MISQPNITGPEGVTFDPNGQMVFFLLDIGRVFGDTVGSGVVTVLHGECPWRKRTATYEELIGVEAET